jgi:sugar phosphate isomerase/epimerase
MKIGLINNPLKSVYEEAVFCGKAGFDFLDLTIEGPHATNIDILKLQSILDSYELEITGHTDPCLPHAYPNQAIRKACLQEMERCAKIFSALGSKIMNIHPCYNCPPCMRNDLITFNIESLRPMVEMAASYDLILVIENYIAPFDRVSVFKTLLEEVPGLKLHLDIGHTNFCSDNHEIFCTKLGQQIRHVHFSDNRSKSDDHLPLGVGTVDWKKVVKALKISGYDDTITLEISCGDTIMQRNYLNLSRKMIMDLWKGMPLVN